MSENDNTKELTADLTDRQLLELIVQRLDRLETRFEGRDTNPLLPLNFVELVQTLATDMHDTRLELRVMREDLDRERKNRVEIAQRLDALEKRAA